MSRRLPRPSARYSRTRACVRGTPPRRARECCGSPRQPSPSGSKPSTPRSPLPSGNEGEKLPAKALRVLMVSARYLPDMGGIETHVHEVARRLNGTNELDITVLATDRTRTRPRREVVDGVSIMRVPAWPRNRDYYLAPGIATVVGQRDRWDLIHCQGIHTPVPALAMMAA